MTEYKVCENWRLTWIQRGMMTGAQLEDYFEALGACKHLPRDRPIDIVVTQYDDGVYVGTHVHPIATVRGEYRKTYAAQPAPIETYPSVIKREPKGRAA